MKTTQKARRLLAQITRIQKMERGKICKMSGRNHFNHQTWHSGYNVVRYVSRGELHGLQQAIDGYARFKKLTQQYADEMIRLTRIQYAKRSPTSSKKKANRSKP